MQPEAAVLTFTEWGEKDRIILFPDQQAAVAWINRQRRNSRFVVLVVYRPEEVVNEEPF